MIYLLQKKFFQGKLMFFGKSAGNTAYFDKSIIKISPTVKKYSTNTNEIILVIQESNFFL